MAYRDSTAVTTTGTSINASKPTLLQTGDILLCYLITDIGLNGPAPTITPPTGWQLISGSNQGSNSGAPDGFTSWVYWKLASNSEPSTWAFSQNGASTQMIAIVTCHSGRNPNPNFITHGTVNTTGNTTPVTVSDTGITANTNDDIIVFATGDITVGTDTWGFSPPTNYTERQDVQVSFNVGTAATRDGVFSGATGTLSFTLTRSAGTGTSGYGVFVIAIPAAYTRPMLSPIFLPHAGMNIKLVELHTPKVVTSGINAYTLSASAGSYSLSGSTVNLTKQLLLSTVAGSYSFSGNTVALKRGYKIIAVLGSYSLTGNSVAFRFTHILSTVAGSYNLTGSSPSLKWAHLLSVISGSYAVSGNSASLLFKRRLIAIMGSYSMTGQATGLLFKRLLGAAAGSYNLSGNSVTLLFKRRLSTVAGSHSLSGSTANLVYAQAGHFVMVTSAGAYNLSGNNASLLFKRLISASAGSYTISGDIISFLLSRLIGASAGVYNLNGNAATLIFSPVNRVMAVQPGNYLLTGSDVILRTGKAITITVFFEDEIFIDIYFEGEIMITLEFVTNIELSINFE